MQLLNLFRYILIGEINVMLKQNGKATKCDVFFWCFGNACENCHVGVEMNCEK